jgi:hypothetical protein
LDSSLNIIREASLLLEPMPSKGRSSRLIYISRAESENKMTPKFQIELTAPHPVPPERHHLDTQKLDGPHRDLSLQLLRKAMEDCLGPLFEDCRSSSSFVIVFVAVTTAQNLATGILVGVQEGTQMGPGSTGAIVSNCLLLGIKAMYAAYLMVYRPQVRSI